MSCDLANGTAYVCTDVLALVLRHGAARLSFGFSILNGRAESQQPLRAGDPSTAAC